MTVSRTCQGLVSLQSTCEHESEIADLKKQIEHHNVTIQVSDTAHHDPSLCQFTLFLYLKYCG